MVQRTLTVEKNKAISDAPVIKKRVGYIDIAKGIGIILVVMGHNDFSLISPFAHKLIYSFHMPMFFFMSGMFFRPDAPFRTFLWNRFSRVLKPFFTTLILIYFASLSFSKISLVTATRRLLKAMYGSGYYIDWVQLWFLPHLFAASLFIYLLYRAVQATHIERLRWVIIVALYGLGVMSMDLFWPFELSILGRTLMLYGLPYGLDMVAVSGLFFFIGCEVRGWRESRFIANPAICVISGLTLVLVVWYFPHRIDLNTRQFDSLLINTIEALIGILFVLSLSRQLERVLLLSSALSYVGQASLIVLLFQVPIQDFWGQKILAITGNLGLSYWLSFVAGVVGPLLINALFIRPNPTIRSWFGQSMVQENQLVELPTTRSSVT
jgi:fucose 4-O-acetylase-like acetyltransferase